MCLPSFVSPSSCTVRLLWCLTYYSLNKWQYFRERKAVTSFKKGSGFIFKGEPIFERLQYGQTPSKFQAFSLLTRYQESLGVLGVIVNQTFTLGGVDLHASSLIIGP